jgi:hypothetical protein
MKCFVIMPFGNRLTDPQHRRQLDLLYEGLIQPAVESVRIPGRPEERISCHRGDTEPRPGEIITHIIENLVQADIAIADLSGRNPNVFYELGVRHAVNDNTILIAQSEEDVPFDLRGQRLIIYQCDFEGGVRLRNALVDAIEDILRTPKKIDNPVRRFLYDREKERIETKGAPPGYDVVKDLLLEIANLRQEFKEQLTEVRKIMHAVTSSQEVAKVEEGPTDGLELFEGTWMAHPSGSLLCARLINGELVVPYSYGNQAMLTGHYYNVRLIGKNLFARFQWLTDSRISGYAMVKVESRDRLVGGWWYSDDVPEEISKDITRIHHHMPGMNEMVLERVHLPELPSWAEEYFARFQSSVPNQVLQQTGHAKDG